MARATGRRRSARAHAGRLLAARRRRPRLSDQHGGQRVLDDVHASVAVAAAGGVAGRRARQVSQLCALLVLRGQRLSAARAHALQRRRRPHTRPVRAGQRRLGQTGALDGLGRLGQVAHTSLASAAISHLSLLHHQLQRGAERPLRTAPRHADTLRAPLCQAHTGLVWRRAAARASAH